MVDDSFSKPRKLAPHPQGDVYFGPFRFDAAAGRLYRGDLETHLAPKAAAVLGLLLSRPGELIPKGEFFDVAWEGITVTDESLTQAISTIRRALSDVPRSPEYVQTVAGEGYRFIARVADAPVDLMDVATRRRRQPADHVDEAPALPTSLVVAPRDHARSVGPWGRGTAALVVAALAVGVAGGRLLWLGSPVAIPSPTRSYALALPSDARSIGSPNVSVAISADGTKIVFKADTPEHNGLWLIDTDGANPQDAFPVPIKGTSGAGSHFLSPGGDWVGFFYDNELRKVPITGGAPLSLSSIGAGQPTGAWSPDGITILFQPKWVSGLLSVPARGGDSSAVTSLDDVDDMGHWSPRFLPDGRHVLFNRKTRHGVPTVALLDRQTGEVRDLLIDAYAPTYSPSGHIVFAQGTALYAVAFDSSTGQLTGQRFKALDEVRGPEANARAAYDLSASGTLVYMTPADPDHKRSLVVVGFDGSERILSPEQRGFIHPSLSPDGRRVAVRDEVTNDIWWLEIADGKLHRVTETPNNYDGFPLWIDNRSLVFGSSRLTKFMDLFSIAIDPLGEPTLLLSDAHNKWPGSVHDNELVYHQDEGIEQSTDLWSLELQLQTGARALLATRFREDWPNFSPDGTWITYTSLRTGLTEVYAAPYPALVPAIRVSDGGGTRYPRWSHDGRSIYYYSRNDSALMKVDLERGSEPKVGEPELLLDFRPYLNYVGILPDGSGVVAVKPGKPRPTHLILTLNWAEELKRLDPSRH